MKRSYFLVPLVLAAVTAAPAAFAATKKPNLQSCRVIGIIPLKQYVTRAERTCYKRSTSAEAQGLSFYNGLTARAVRRADRNNKCNFISANQLDVYFPSRQVKCFSRVAQAEARGYTKLGTAAIATPTATVTPVATVPGTATPVATPTPLPTPISEDQFVADPGATWKVTLQNPDGLNTGQTGDCEAAFNADRSLFRYACTSNVQSDYEAHIEVTGGTLGKWCMVPFNQNGNTSQNFSRICRVDSNYDGVNQPPVLTDEDWRDMILGQRTSTVTGQKIRAFISIHHARGAENEEINGYITAP